jgi:hypothetical protein
MEMQKIKATLPPAQLPGSFAHTKPYHNVKAGIPRAEPFHSLIDRVFQEE